MRTILFLFIIGIGIHFPNYAQNALNLEDLISIAITNSNNIMTQKKYIDVLEQSIPITTNMPDPQVTLGITNLPVNSFSLTQEPMTGKMISVSQKIPFPGKLSTMKELVRADIPVKEAELEATKENVVYFVKKLYYDLSIVEASIKAIEEKQTLLKGLSSVVRTKYEVSQSSQGDILAIDLALSNYEESIIGLKGKKQSLVSQLKILLQNDDITNIETINFDELHFKLPEKQTLVDLAFENNSALKKSSLLEQKMKIAEQSASLNYYPDFNVSIAYSQRDYLDRTSTDLDDFLSFTVGFNIPLGYGGKYKAEEQKATLMQEYFNLEYLAQFQQAEMEISGVLELLSGNMKKGKHIKEVSLIQAAQLYNAVLSEYHTGKKDFLQLIKSLEKQVDIELKYITLNAEILKQFAQLENIIGTDLDPHFTYGKEK